MAKEIAEEYASSLADLTVNSKPLINMLTILAEENIDHAGVIVETVEKHLEKVNPEIKLPVLYLVDSIIKNVGGAYLPKFSQSIVNMFTKTFKQVDEKTRSQMFKLRETWHDVFPATKLYQMDVKVNLIDPAWPIQAQPHQANIHVNPNFLKKNVTSATSSTVAIPEEDDKMRSMLAKKEQELLMLQKKKVEMELEHMKRQLEVGKKLPPAVPAAAMPVALVNPVLAAPAPPLVVAPEVAALPVKQRLGPPVNKSGRIAPVSAALISARRDPRLARHAPATAPPPAAPTPAPPPPPIAPNVFDIKPLDRVTKRKNAITIDVRPETRRRDPRLESRNRRRDERRKLTAPPPPVAPLPPAEDILEKLQAPDPRRINKLPPIPKINRDRDPERDSNAVSVPPKRKKETREHKRREDKSKDKEKDSSSSSPEKRAKSRDIRRKRIENEVKPVENEPVAFKELKNFNKDRYMRRNKEKSESPEHLVIERALPVPTPAQPETDPSNVPEISGEAKDVDLRVLPIVEKPAPIAAKRPSTEAVESKSKKNKLDKFDILFGNEDVDLRQLPQVEEVNPTPVPHIQDSSMSPEEKEMSNDKHDKSPSGDERELSPKGSPKRDWNEVKEKRKDEAKKTPTPLDLVRAKLAKATEGKDRLGRPLMFSKSPSIEKERRRTLSSEDTDLRDGNENFDAEDHKKTIAIIMSQAKEQFSDGQLDKGQYNALMYQVLQLNEKLKLKEAKQRESLEISKRKLKAHIQEENKVHSPKSSPNEMNRFGDIDERVTPLVFVDTPPDSQEFTKDSDMRTIDGVDGMKRPLLPYGPGMPAMYPGPTPAFGPMWRGQGRPRNDEFGRRFRGPAPYLRAKFDKTGPRGFQMPRLPNLPLPPPIPNLPTPQLGICQGECPLKPYERVDNPPPLGTPNIPIPPTDFHIIEYIDLDPVKTIQIDGIPREIRFYGDTAVIMIDWDDPREIKFLPGCRRVTFDNKDSVVLSFNEGYKQIEIDDQVFDIKYGAPTRELYINGRWHECFFGGAPIGVIIDGKPRLLHLEGPLPQVDIGKAKRTDLVAGKINLIVDATQICPIYLDAKVQKFTINNLVFTIRFVDALRTVLINEQPFKVEFGELPNPIYIGGEKHFIRFSALPRGVRPGYVQIANMEGSGIPTVMAPPPTIDGIKDETMEVDEPPAVIKSPSPERSNENQGLDILASVMPTTMEFASGSDYSVANPIFNKTEKIPGLETPMDENPPPSFPGLPILGNLNVTDLFAKLVATGIVPLPTNSESNKEEKVEVKAKLKEDKSVIHKVDLLKSETLRVKQPGLVSALYGGMQCSGCGCRFPPEQTVRYSQHLDWHFRQNRRERDSARRAHSRHWHYDLADWLQYEEIDEVEDREKNWFESNGTEQGAPPSPVAEAPSVAAGAPADCRCHMCGDKFDQFYNEDKEEWHLRNSIRHEDKNYHPICYEDYKASLAKEEAAAAEADEVIPIDKTETEEAIEIADGDGGDQSDTESVVEVLDEEKTIEQLEIPEDDEDDGDDDDVVLKAEPVEEVLVEDNDTDDETTEQRGERDRLAAEDFARIKVKQEPVDPDDEPIITAEEAIIPSVLTTTHNTVLSSIDGNMQLEAPPMNLPTGGIRINISKSIPTFISTHEDPMLEDISADDEPLPPGEEMELEYKLKPSLEGVQFSRQPPQQKGNELSGLCSIM